AWMDRVKHLFGVMLIGVAIYLLGTIPAVPVLLLWAVLLIMFGIYLVKSQTPILKWRYAWNALGTLCIIWGMLAMFGGLNGGRNILQPVSLTLFSGEVLKDAASQKGQPQFYKVTSVAEFEQLLSDARSDGQSVILDFYADWCTDCLRMEKTTFNDPQVRTDLTPFRLLKLDVTDPSDPVGKTIKQRYGVYGPPALLFFNAQGQELLAKRLYGYLDPNRFLSLLKTLRE
ncbi:MAG TPA: thioredoxin family protein, partial [Arenicellales bacterium]|nr:thioredoxin family protein [Arenicellales bacterium]